MTKIYLVAEGEVYYDAWIPHILCSDADQANQYAVEISRSNGCRRWPMELDILGAQPLPVDIKDVLGEEPDSRSTFL